MDDSLVARRSKRSTAGNRMEAALAEFKAEDLGIDIEEDADFALDKDEDDIFESDFESTDEEGAQEEVDAVAEKLIRQEESRCRKTARTHLERITALAHARQAATFNPTAIGPHDPDKQKVEKKIKRRVSLGIAVDAETGEVLEGDVEVTDASVSATTIAQGRRHSTRTHTVANTSATVSRVRDEVRKQSSTPKRARMKIRAPTQAELIARALDMEEGNIEEHRNYLTLEEEKRKKARVVRMSVQGPLIRWVSKKEEVTVLVQLPPPAPALPATRPAMNPYIHYRYPQSPAPSNPSFNATGTLYTSTSPRYTSSQHRPNPHTPTQPVPHHTPIQHTSQCFPTQHTSQYSGPPVQSPSTSTSSHSFPSHQWSSPPPPPTYTQNTPISAPPNTTTVTSTSMPSSAFIPTSIPIPEPMSTSTYTTPPLDPIPSSPSQPIERKETVSRQYVVHELDQAENTPRPNWTSTMTAMFGDHVDWENSRVYTTKGRPYSRPTLTCPVTGKVAKYLDPRTNVPYADLGAFRVLSAVLRHEYVWSPSLECYVSREGSAFAQGNT